MIQLTIFGYVLFVLVFKVLYQLTNLTLHIDILLPCCGLWGRSARNKYVQTIRGDSAAKNILPAGSRAGNEHLQSLKFYKHGGGPH